jgi:hypothetical protein
VTHLYRRVRHNGAIGTDPMFGLTMVGKGESTLCRHAKPPMLTSSRDADFVTARVQRRA